MKLINIYWLWAVGRSQEQKSKRSPTEQQSHSDNCAAAAAPKNFYRTIKYRHRYFNTAYEWNYVMQASKRYRQPNTVHNHNWWWKTHFSIHLYYSEVQTELLEGRYSLLFQKPKWWWHYWLPLWNLLRDRQPCPDSPSEPKQWTNYAVSFYFGSTPTFGSLDPCSHITGDYVFFIAPPVFSVPFSVVVPVSQSRHAMTAGSNAAEHRGRGDDVPSTPHCSPPER